MIFGNLFKPKWQHKNPEIRKQALLDLDDSGKNDDVWTQVATEDQEPELRKLAVQRLEDIKALAKIVESDSNAAVKDAAQARLKNILSGKTSTQLTYEQRVKYLEQNHDLEIIEHVAQFGEESALRLAAIDRVEREALLGEVAINDADANLRFYAAQKLHQTHILERVYKQVRARDKRVARYVKDLLSKADEVQQQKDELLSSAAAICEQVESLRDSKNRSRIELALSQAQTDWEALDGEPPESLKNKFATGKRALEEILAAPEPTAEEKAADVEATKNELCEVLEKLVSDVQARENMSDSDLAAIIGILRTTTSSWENLQPLADEDKEATYQRRFSDAAKLISQAQSGLRDYQAALDQLTKSKQTLEKINGKSKSINEKQLQKVGNELKSIAWPEGFGKPDELLESTNGLFNQLESQIATKKANIEAQIEQVADLVSKAEAALEQGQTARTTEYLKKARQKFRSVNGAPSKVYHDLKQRIQVVSSKIDELRDWQGWANAPQKEKLCQEMETLKDAEMPPQERANAINALQKKWKSLGPTDPAVSDQLWERFKTAADVAYEPCKAFFEAQAEQRAEHLKARLALAEEIQQYVADTDWDNVDWKAAFKREDSYIKRWRDCGIVDRKDKKEAQDKFDQAIQALRAKLNVEKERNAFEKQQLIKKLETLLSATDVRQATDDAKRIQKQWRDIGTAGRKTDNELWKRLRAICDELFGKLREEIESEQGEREEIYKSKVALCEEIESYASLEGDELGAVLGKVKHAQQQWRDMGLVPKDKVQEINQRFREACNKVFELRNKEQLEKAKAAKALLEEKASYVIAQEESFLANELAEIDGEQWSAFTSLPDDLELALQNRISALKVALENNDKKQALIDLTEKNKATLEQMCLELEVALELPTPEQFSEDRMTYQMNRLSEQMGKGNTSASGRKRSQLNHAMKWLTAGPISKEVRVALQPRYNAIMEKLEATD